MSKKQKNDFNRDSHPERMPDEVFITNADFDKMLLSDDEDTRSSWEAVGWKTKRRGIVAYDINGIPLGNRWPDSFPVFVKQDEIKKVDEKILNRLLPQN